MARQKRHSVKNREVVLPEATAVSKNPKRRRNTLIVATVVSILILAITGVGIYLGYWQPYHKTFIVVDNESIDMTYFINRVIMNAGNDTSKIDIWGTMQSIVNEMIIRQEAPQYVGDVTQQEIDDTMKAAYQGDSQDITDAEFKEMYRQNLEASQLTEQQFRDIVKSSILREKLRIYLSDRVPSVAPQAHLYMIMLNDYDAATNVKERLNNGEDFSVLAEEQSIDSSKDNGGDIGWFPYKVLSYGFEQAATNLEIGQPSDPIIAIDPDSVDYNDPNQVLPYAIVKVVDRVDAMQVTDDQLTQLKSRTFSDWLDTIMTEKTINFRGLKKNYDSYTEAWLNYQVQKRMKAMGATSSTTASTAPAQ